MLYVAAATLETMVLNINSFNPPHLINKLLQKELDYLRKVFVEINEYPSKTVENIRKLEKKFLIPLTNHRPILLSIVKQKNPYFFHSREKKAFRYYPK